MPFLDLSRVIREGTAIGISDGSHRKDWGTEAFHIISHIYADQQW
jgi:hypothetical protein